MFRRSKVEETELDRAIDKVHAEMTGVPADSEDYAKMVKQLNKLYKLKNTSRSQRVSPDTLALIAGNIAVTLVIVGYEHAHVVTTRARDFWHKIN